MDARALLPDATRSLVRTVDGLPDAAYAEPSLLPGWSRGHVVAHLTLNAEALAAVLNAQATGRPLASVYASSVARDDDIEALAGAEPGVLRARLLAATTAFSDACDRMPDHAWTGSVPRAPGSDIHFVIAEVPSKRLNEVEIHHVDLGAGRHRSAWSDELAARLVADLSGRLAPQGPLTLRASDLGMSWPVGGDGGPWISGTAADLAWWLTGRGTGDDLTAESGSLPPTGQW